MVAVSALVSGLDAELVRLGYKDSTMVWYRGCWRRLQRYFAARGVEEFSLELAMAWVDEACGFFAKEQAGTLKQTDVYLFRVAQMLGDYVAHGAVLRRYSRPVSKLTGDEAAAVARFEASLRAAGRSASTVRSYGTLAGEFTAFAGTRGGIARCDAGTLEAFVATLAGYQVKTVEQKLCAVRSFLREGSAVQDTLTPDRIVAGVASDTAEAVVREIYRPLTEAGTPLLITDFATAELVKGAANAFLATKISFINAMADICRAVGGDVIALADALGMDPRIGRSFLRAGIGYGGGCLPKDVRGLAAFADQAGVRQTSELLLMIDAVNTARREQTVRIVAEAVTGVPVPVQALASGLLTGKHVAVWGAAFKPGTDDIRDSSRPRHRVPPAGPRCSGDGLRPDGHGQCRGGLA
jgi:UDP-glucose/GDP-mannose dehydrogenase family, central domain/UDP-glucose/GDP-mannose dehydrogenase family, NAD binding domain